MSGKKVSFRGVLTEPKSLVQQLQQTGPFAAIFNVERHTSIQIFGGNLSKLQHLYYPFPTFVRLVGSVRPTSVLIYLREK